MASFSSETKKRRILRVAAAYAVAAVLVFFAGRWLLETIGAPENGLRVLVIVLALGFPVVLATSWFYQVTPEDLRRDPSGQR